jgi:hypothetical protein
VQKAATAAGQSWINAVNAGDAAAVVARSCAQDKKAYDAGTATNPSVLAGKNKLAVQRVVVSGPEALMYFTVTPAIKDRTTYGTYMVMESGWKVCFTQTKP